MELHPRVPVTYNLDNYRPKRSFGQGNIFTPVCHSVHRGGMYLVPGGAPGPGGCTWSRGGTWSGGVYLVPGGVPGPGGVYLVRGGVYLVWGGVYLVPGGTWSWGVHLVRGCTWSGGVYLVRGGTWSGTPPGPGTPPGLQTPEYGQRSAGTHPTGMHSCSLMG